MSDEVDVIQHLMEIEKEASTSILEAQKSADEIIALARTDSENQFKEKYSLIVKEIEKNEEQKKVEIKVQSQAALEDYKKSLVNSKKNTNAFETSFEEILRQELY